MEVTSVVGAIKAALLVAAILWAMKWAHDTWKATRR